MPGAETGWHRFTGRNFVQQALQCFAESCCQLREQPLTLSRGRAARITEDAVRADRPHTPAPQDRHELFNRQTASGSGSARANRLGRQRKHERRFGPASVRVAARQASMPCAAGTALMGQSAGGRCHRFGIASVPVD